MPKLDAVPNKEFMTTLVGEIQDIQLDMPNPVKKILGTQYQIKPQAMAMRKSLDGWHVGQSCRNEHCERC